MCSKAPGAALGCVVLKQQSACRWQDVQTGMLIGQAAGGGRLQALRKGIRRRLWPSCSCAFSRQGMMFLEGYRAAAETGVGREDDVACQKHQIAFEVSW